MPGRVLAALDPIALDKPNKQCAQSPWRTARKAADAVFWTKSDLCASKARHQKILLKLEWCLERIFGAMLHAANMPIGSGDQHLDLKVVLAGARPLVTRFALHTTHLLPLV
jgi:hypothetical protein